ncbi:hypothetical protein FDF08_09640 [Micrococcus luteus]|nr:hypothetical protein FDF08_09640 [Micrococcus luteus]
MSTQTTDRAPLGVQAPTPTVLSWPRVETVPTSPRAVAIWSGAGPAGTTGPGEWLTCPSCCAVDWFPHGGHGRVLLMEALDQHLTCHRSGRG